jgi:hypothetical protein
MEMHRNGLERTYLCVEFLRGERVEKERILEERYACHRMADWTAKGIEFKVRNRPVELRGIRSKIGGRLLGV